MRARTRLPLRAARETGPQTRLISAGIATQGTIIHRLLNISAGSLTTTGIRTFYKLAYRTEHNFP